MKIVKNNAKKLLSIAALAALTLCGIARGMTSPFPHGTQGRVPHISQINENNIVITPSDSIREIIDEQIQIIKADENPEILIKNTSRVARAKIIAKAITERNIKKINPWTIKFIIEADASLAKIFASYITKENFQQMPSWTIDCLLEGEPSLAQTFVKYITKNTIQYLDPYITTVLVYSDKTLASTIASYITQDNIHTMPLTTVKTLLNIDESLAHDFISCITSENILYISPKTLQMILIGDYLGDKSEKVASCVTPSNLHKIDLEIMRLLFNTHMREILISKITNQLTENNILTLYHLVPIMCENADLYTSNIIKNKVKTLISSKKQLFKPSQLELDRFLWSPIAFKNFLAIQHRLGIQQILKQNNKSFSYQHIATNYHAICEMFSERLQKDQSLRETLFKIVERETSEKEIGRYTIAHGRKANRFVRDQVWLWLKEIESKQPIARTSWYPMHWKTNGTSMPYKNVSEVIKHGRGSTEDRKSVQFASNLFGCKRGSSALDYVLRNKNVDNLSTQETIEELFEYFGREKYCKLGAEYFADAEELAATMKYGTLLLYSFTPEALERFAFVTHKSGAGKGDITLLTPDGKEFDTSSPKKVLDTLLHNPNSFKDQSKNHEYVIAVCDDDTKDKTKLGTQNPFNQELRTYHFNFGKDQQLASEIKRLVAAGFMQIIPAMIKDEVITKELACELVKANPLFKQKSRL